MWKNDLDLMIYVGLYAKNQICDRIHEPTYLRYLATIEPTTLATTDKINVDLHWTGLNLTVNQLCTLTKTLTYDMEASSFSYNRDIQIETYWQVNKGDKKSKLFSNSNQRIFNIVARKPMALQQLASLPVYILIKK